MPRRPGQVLECGHCDFVARKVSALREHLLEHGNGGSLENVKEEVVQHYREFDDYNTQYMENKMGLLDTVDMLPLDIKPNMDDLEMPIASFQMHMPAELQNIKSEPDLHSFDEWASVPAFCENFAPEPNNTACVMSNFPVKVETDSSIGKNKLIVDLPQKKKRRKKKSKLTISHKQNSQSEKLKSEVSEAEAQKAPLTRRSSRRRKEKSKVPNAMKTCGRVCKKKKNGVLHGEEAIASFKKKFALDLLQQRKAAQVNTKFQSQEDIDQFKSKINQDIQKQQVIRRMRNELDTDIVFRCSLGGHNEANFSRAEFISHVMRFHRDEAQIIYCSYCPYVSTNFDDIQHHTASKHKAGQTQLTGKKELPSPSLHEVPHIDHPPFVPVEPPPTFSEALVTSFPADARDVTVDLSEVKVNRDSAKRKKINSIADLLGKCVQAADVKCKKNDTLVYSCHLCLERRSTNGPYLYQTPYQGLDWRHLLRHCFFDKEKSSMVCGHCHGKCGHVVEFNDHLVEEHGVPAFRYLSPQELLLDHDYTPMHGAKREPSILPAKKQRRTSPNKKQSHKKKAKLGSDEDGFVISPLPPEGFSVYPEVDVSGAPHLAGDLLSSPNLVFIADSNQGTICVKHEPEYEPLDIAGKKYNALIKNEPRSGSAKSKKPLASLKDLKHFPSNDSTGEDVEETDSLLEEEYIPAAENVDHDMHFVFDPDDFATSKGESIVTAALGLPRKSKKAKKKLQAGPKNKRKSKFRKGRRHVLLRNGCCPEVSLCTKLLADQKLVEMVPCVLLTKCDPLFTVS